MHGKRLYAAGAALLIAILACNAPATDTQAPSGPNAVFTAAAQTVAAHQTGVIQTQDAQAAGATSTPGAGSTETSGPVVTMTPSPAPATLAPASSTPVCDQMSFISDVTIADGTNEDPGTSFTKTWRVQNVGNCAWSSAYTLVYVSGNAMGGPATVPLSGTVNPGDTVDLSVNLTAPEGPGDTTGTWRLRNASGVLFGLMTVNIHVNGGGPFRVTHVEFTVTGTCGAFHINAAFSTNGAGTVRYHWVYSDGGTDSTTHPALVFTAAGTQSVAFDDSISTSGSNWIDTYIDVPNHQQFGRAQLTCP